MEEEKRARAGAGEAAESPRKAPRLEPPAAAAADSGCDELALLELSDLIEEAAAATSDTDSERCSHIFCMPDEIDAIFAEIESSKGAPTCEHYLCRVTGRSSILVCTECNSHHCTGVAAKDKPQGHARWHAENNEHWFALWYNDPYLAYCFMCERNMHYGAKNREDVGEMVVDYDAEDVGEMVVDYDAEDVGEMVVDYDAGGHASGLANGHGYVVRGMPNLGNTCYVNALVQCFLVLGKLRARMLGPDAPTGLLGTLLVDLFAETNGGNDARRMLDSRQLLACIRLGDSRFVGNNMQDSHELLVSLRRVLDEEEKLKEPDMQEGAPSAVVPTVTDSIFGGQLRVTTTCKCCSINSVSHDVFYDISVPLPSKESSAKSVVSPPRNKSRRSQGKIRIKLFPAIDKSNMEKIQTIAEGSESQVPGSELEDVVMEKTPKPLEVDSTEAEQIWQSKDVVHSPLQTQKDDVRGEIIDVPLKAVDFLSHVLFDVKVQGMDETTADSYSPQDIGPPPLVFPLREKNPQMTSGSDVKQNNHAGLDDMLNELEASIKVKENTYSVDKGKAQCSDTVYDEAEDISSLASIEDCLALHFKAEVIERRCEKCFKVAEQPSTNTSKDEEQTMATNENTTVDGDQTEKSDRKTCQNEQSSDLYSLALECTSSSRQPHGSDAQHQVILAVDRTTKRITSGMSCGDKDTASCSTANKKPECHEGVQEAVPSCLPAEKQTNLLSAQDSQNASTLNQGRGKQVNLDHSAHQVDQNEQKDRSGYAIQTRLFSKLPPVLIIHLKRSMGLLKARGHVSFKEILDVGAFMDPSSEDKDNFSYRLVGVIEHRGGFSADAGHYVAYVKPSHQQQSCGSSSWFYASDDNIREVSIEEVLKCEAYILFYERMEG